MAASVSPRWDLSDAVSQCNYGNEDAVVDLLTNVYTPLYFDDTVYTLLYADPMAWQNSIMNRWPSEQFDYGQGDVPYKEIYHPTYVPRGRQFFQNDTLRRPDEISGASEGNSNCVFCYIDIPTGGKSKITGRFIRRDYRTAQVCARDIATSRDYWSYAERIVEQRVAAEQTTMIDFYNVVGIDTAGYKVLLESGHPDAATSPRALTLSYPQTYMEDYFPPVFNAENIQPLSLQLLNEMSQKMLLDYKFNGARTMAAGAPRFTIETSEDLWMTLVVANPQWTETLRWTAPMDLFRGYNPNNMSTPGDASGFGNWRFMQNPYLPRYTTSTVDGGLVEVQPYITVTTENGVEAILNPDWINAPFGVAFVTSPNQATLLTQPPITTNQGITIPNVQGTGWRPWNEYDPLCNPEKLKPFWKFHFRNGWMPNRPWEAVAIVYRRQEYVLPAANVCNLYPITPITPDDESCADLNGACSGRTPLQASITKVLSGDEVQYTHTLCGGARYIEVRVKFQANRPNGLIDCACGGAVRVYFSDDTQRSGTILNTRWATPVLPYDTYLIDLGSGGAVPEGGCVTLLQCLDGTPATATILECVESETAGEVIIYTEQPLVCTEGWTYTVTTVDETEIEVTLEDSDPENLKYTISAVGLDCTDSGGLAGGTITCAA